ncbi:MAG: DUF4384 domain-containing protein [Azospirillum sp.]|nr:DUF4384 domain-containing protein [Azospirillum sp.]
MFGRALLWIAVVATLGSGPATAEDLLRRSLVAVPFNVTQAVDVSITTSRPSVRIGETIEICFQASQPGYVTLWDIATDGQVGRVFPNAYSGDGGARRIDGGARQCAGIQGDAFRFQVGGPPGLEDLYLVWTTAGAAQPTQTGYRSAAAFAADLDRLRQQAANQWATAKTSFDILPSEAAQVAPRPPAAAPPPPPSAWPSAAPLPPVPPAAAPPPPPRPPTAAAPPRPPAAAAPPPSGAVQEPQIRILAMGANVKPLTKSNQDAEVFVKAMKDMFGVKSANIRLYRNVYKRQFKEGMDWLRESAGPEDLVVIYYSGHGAQVPDRSGSGINGNESAFVPYEFNNEDRAGPGDFVRNSEFVKWVNAIPSGNIVTVIDSCHSGGFYRSLGETLLGAKPKFYVPPATLFDAMLGGDRSPAAAQQVTAAPPMTRGIGEPDDIQKAQPRGKGILLAAARWDQYALELEDGSLFTLALVEVMEKAHSGNLNDVFNTVAREVDQASKKKQSPVAVGQRAIAERIRFVD